MTIEAITTRRGFTIGVGTGGSFRKYASGSRRFYSSLKVSEKSTNTLFRGDSASRRVSISRGSPNRPPADDTACVYRVGDNQRQRPARASPQAASCENSE